MASLIGNKLGGIANKIDYSVLNKPKTTRKWLFWVSFIFGTLVGSYFVYRKYQTNKQNDNRSRKSTSVYVFYLIIALLISFIVAYIIGFFAELFGTMNLKQAMLMCQKYGFKEGTLDFQKCLINEQRARETRNMIAASYYR